MSQDIPIKNTQDAVKKVFQVTQFSMTYPRFVEITATKIVNEVILDKIHDRMRELNFSPKIIERTFIDNVVVDTEGFVEFEVISDYEAEEGFDVAKAREEGTKDHFIGPLVKKALSWIQAGVRFFSLGHWVKGFDKTDVIEKTIKEFTPLAQQRLNEETDQRFTDIVGN